MTNALFEIANTGDSRRVHIVELLSIGPRKAIIGYGLMIYGLPNRNFCTILTTEEAGKKTSIGLEVKPIEKANIWYRTTLGTRGSATTIREYGILKRLVKEATK